MKHLFADETLVAEIFGLISLIIEGTTEKYTML